MRKLILKMSMSLDGFVSGPNGENKWIFSRGDVKAKEWLVETLSNASLHIMGSRSFQGMAPYWPTATDAFAAPINNIPKAVFTRGSYKGIDRASIAPTADEAASESWVNATIVSGDICDEIATLKAQDGKNIIAHGGASFAQSLSKNNLIDEYHLLIHPISLGAGLPLFSPEYKEFPLDLVHSTIFPSGIMANIYKPQ